MTMLYFVSPKINSYQIAITILLFSSSDDELVVFL